MKGRARMQNAKFYVFENCHPDATFASPITLNQAQEVEQLVKRMIELREPNIPDTYEAFASVPYSGKSASLEIKALHEGEYRAPKGCVEVRSAKSLLNRYSLSIPLDTSSRSSRQAMLLHMPMYDGYRLTMPAHLPSSVRMVILPDEFRVNSNSREIQNRLALMACVRLHSLNLLNDRLLPLRRRDMHERLLKVALQKLPDVGERPPHDSFPANTGESKQVYLHKIIQRGSKFDSHNDFLGCGKKTFGVVTIIPLMPTPDLKFEHIELNEVKCEIGKNQAIVLSPENMITIADFFSVLMDCRWSKRTGNLRIQYADDRNLLSVIPPYTVVLLNEEGDLDWERMKAVVSDFRRSKEERKNALKAISTSKTFIPRLLVPIYEPNNTYLAVGNSGINCAAKFPHREEYETYADYFEMKQERKMDNTNASLIAVQRLWHNPRKMHREKWVFSNRKRKANEIDENATMTGDELQEGEQAPLVGLESALLPDELCMEALLPDAALNLHAILLPQILYHIEQCLTTRSFVYYCKERLPLLGSYMEKVDLFDILEMLTAKSCSMSISYDRLEVRALLLRFF